MPINIDDSNIYTQLRDKAEAQLEAGTHASTNHWSLGVDALRLLHRLSSNPENAEDALKLLHELQVHQVELDLQNEEIAANERALVKALSLYRELYDSAPFSYFLVDLMGNVIQGNHAAAELFGIDRDDLPGQRIDALLSPHGRSTLLDLLRWVARQDASSSCLAEASGGTNPPRQLQFMASNSTRRGYVLLACWEHANSSSP